MRELIYYNDTGRDVGIHQGIDKRVKFKNVKIIKHGQMIQFSYPEEFTPILKTWDHGGKNGLQILLMLVDLEELRVMQ